MDKFAGIVGRQYKLFDYVGAPDAERVIVLMGSSADIAHEAVNALTAAGEKVGIVKVRLYRPFSVEHLMAAIPATAKIVTALDRCKEPGGAGEPLYQDIITAVVETGRGLRVLGGRYGLASKEFTAAMVKGVFDNMAAATPKNHFTVGINDDVTHTSIAYDPTFSVESKRGVRAMFYGLGADGTVGANHNSIRIIGAETDNYAQGYFSYDSKKSGTITTSHLRFGPDPIRLSNLIESANFVACHQWTFLERVNVLAKAETGATFLLASPFGPDEVWDQLPRQVQAQIIAKKLRFYVIDAIGVAKATGMGGRINTIMQTCFFAISGVLPRDEAIEKIKESIRHTYGRRGEAVVLQNFAAVDHTLSHLYEVKYPDQVTSKINMESPVPDQAPAFLKDVTAQIIAGNGDDLPVSAFPVDGTWPSATTQWEKRNLALEIPVWDSAVCIQCGKCALVCPHAAIRTKVYPPENLTGAPETYKAVDYKSRDLPGMKYTVQVAPGRLHRLCAVRGCLPGQEQEPAQVQGDQHGAATGAPLHRARQLPVLPGSAGTGSHGDPVEQRQEFAAPSAALRVLRRVLRLRRDALRQAGQPALRRSRHRRQRDRLLLDLRRQPADDAVGDGQERPRAGLVEQPLRGQRRVRAGLPPDHRQTGRVRPRAGADKSQPAR